MPRNGSDPDFHIGGFPLAEHRHAITSMLPSVEISVEGYRERRNRRGTDAVNRFGIATNMRTSTGWIATMDVSY
jgi:hypothetical protein